MIMMLKGNGRAVAWLFLIVGVSSFLGCARQDVSRSKKYSETEMLMGTMVQLDVCRDQLSAAKIKNVYRDIWARLENIAWKMNVLDERSDVAKINNSNSRPVLIGADTYRVIKDAIRYSQSTEGAFDITVWPLIDFWQRNEKKDIFPTEDEVKRAQGAVGFRHIQLLANEQIRLLKENVKLDLGGIAKGYAADEAARIFRKHGVENFFIDAGGDIYVGGSNCIGESWRIGIRDPRNLSEIIDVVVLSNKAVVTSGDYEQYYEIQGQRWSHIMNPITGYPQKGVISATVIASSAMEADALATALCVLGGESGTDYINALDGSQASFIISKMQSKEIKKFLSQKYKNFQYKK